MNIVIKNGLITRRIKPDWITLDKKSIQIRTVAFDLRDWTPPETYVSFYQLSCCDSDISYCDSNNDNNRYIRAHFLINNRLQKYSGAVAVFDIPETLKKINKYREIIKFTEQNLPHCGMYFTSGMKEDILFAKTRLCVLASKNIQTHNQKLSLEKNIPLIAS